MDQLVNQIKQRGTEEVIGENDLDQRLNSDRALNIKLGVDPTSADLHLGHAVVLRKLREFQDLGHQTYLVIGDFTASIGDPAGVKSTRPILTEQEIQHNMQTYLDQAEKVLDIEKTHIVYNSEWLKSMNLGQFIGYAMQVSLNTLIEREDFSERLKQNQSVGLHELIYPIVQGVDSVWLKADVEIGGWDQRLNMLMGRELQKKLGQNAQVIIAMKPLIGLDGQKKMSKSYGNYIGLSEPADQMFGKVMSINDELIDSYAELAANMSEHEREQLKHLHPRQAKADVAHRIVELYHSKDEADRAAEGFDRTFKEKEISPELVKEVVFSDNQIPVIQAITQSTGVSSSEARRLIEQGGVRLNGEVVVDAQQQVDLSNQKSLLQVGKHRFFELKCE